MSCWLISCAHADHLAAATLSVETGRLPAQGADRTRRVRIAHRYLAMRAERDRLRRVIALERSGTIDRSAAQKLVPVPPPPAPAVSEGDWMAREMGTRRWFIGRNTAKAREAGKVGVSPTRYDEIRHSYAAHLINGSSS